jgi:hypothetical protein
VRRLLPRQRAALVLIIAFTVASMSGAFATPQTGGNPSVTLDIVTQDGQNLTSGQTVNVTGAGFGSSLGGTVFQCGFLSGVKVCSNIRVPFMSTAAGNIAASLNVTSTFTGTNAQNQMVQVSCVPTPTPPCTIEAETDNGQFFSAHTISFANGGSTTLSTTTSTSVVIPTTTSTTNTTMGTTTSTSTTMPTTTSTTALSACDKARLAKTAFNAQIDANIAAVNASGLSSADKAAAIARLNAIRDQGNAQLDAQLANCP